MTRRPIETRTLAHLGGQVALAADRAQDPRILLGMAVTLALGLENVMRHLVDVAADPLQNIRAAINHRVEEFHQHHLAGDGGRARPRQLALDQGERLRLVVAHRHQAVPGQDEGHGRGRRHLGVGMAHQRRRHVAGAVLDIEPAGNLDFLHVLAGGDGDPGQPFDRLVLRRAGIEEVDPDRAIGQRCDIFDRGFLEDGLGRNENRKHAPLPGRQDISP